MHASKMRGGGDMKWLKLIFKKNKRGHRSLLFFFVCLHDEEPLKSQRDLMVFALR